MFDKNNKDFEYSEDYFAYLLDNNIPFDREDLCMMIECCYHDSFRGELHRWFIEASTICEVKGKFYCIDWEEGSTEMQEDEFPYQPYEVEPKERVITVTDWVRK